MRYLRVLICTLLLIIANSFSQTFTDGGAVTVKWDYAHLDSTGQRIRFENLVSFELCVFKADTTLERTISIEPGDTSYTFPPGPYESKCLRETSGFSVKTVWAGIRSIPTKMVWAYYVPPIPYEWVVLPPMGLTVEITPDTTGPGKIDFEMELIHWHRFILHVNNTMQSPIIKLQLSFQNSTGYYTWDEVSGTSRMIVNGALIITENITGKWDSPTGDIDPNDGTFELDVYVELADGRAYMKTTENLKAVIK